MEDKMKPKCESCNKIMELWENEDFSHNKRILCYKCIKEKQKSEEGHINLEIPVRNYNEIINIIKDKTNLSKEKIEKIIEKKIKKLSNLVTKEGAAEIVAAELGAVQY